MVKTESKSKPQSQSSSKTQSTSNKVGKNAQETNTEAASKSIWQDERFQHLVSDPRFRNIPQQQKKLKIDKRFQGMFTNEKFNIKYTVDKYGRKINNNASNDLRKFYDLQSENESSASDVDKDEELDSEKEELEDRRKEEKAILNDESDASNDALDSIGDENNKQSASALRDRLLDPDVDYARGEGRLVTDSSSDETSDEENSPETYLDHVWGELDNDAETTDTSTNRLAVCNMDWDRIRAVDLMVLFNSFLPAGGSILTVKIYPSEYGKQRMADEDIHGPAELVGLGSAVQQDENKSDKGEDSSSDQESESKDSTIKSNDSDIEEGDSYHMEKLRQYQLNRLRYFYAVVVCDSVATADKIYRECDGIEYESSATRVDLRFIPDNTEFDENEVKDACSELPETNDYKPRQFTTTALQQVKVELTWDEAALERKELGDKLFSQKLDAICEADLKNIVSYSTDDDEEESHCNGEESNKGEDNPKSEVSGIEKYKALLAEIHEKERQQKEQKDYEMEFSWQVEDENDTEKKASEIDKSQLTPIEKILLKRSEKNRKRKELRKRKSKQNSSDEYSDLDSISEGIDWNDPYYAEEFANGDFLDPREALKEKRKKRKEKLVKEAEENEKAAKELQLLLNDGSQSDQNKKHFSLDKIISAEKESKTSKRNKRKQLKKSKLLNDYDNKIEEDNFQINVNDERFKAIYDKHEFNIDPSDSHYKKTKGMEKLIQEKLKRRQQKEEEFVDVEHKNDDKLTIESNDFKNRQPNRLMETAVLIKNLKRKIGSAD